MRAILAAALLGAGVSPAAAQKSADTLRITLRDALPNIDPYYNNLRTGVVLHHQAWDALVYRDPDTFKIEPLLATEWKQPDTTTIEFTLRPGVKFHDGSPFTADDVVYTLNLVADPASKVSTPANYNWIDKAEKTGELVGTRQAEAANARGAGLFRACHCRSIPRPIARRSVPMPTPRRRSAPAPTRSPRSSRASPPSSNGSTIIGPAAPRARPAIKKMSVRYVAGRGDRNDRTALRSCRLDLELNPGPVRQRRQAPAPAGRCARESMRIGYLSLDAAGRTGADNPFTKLKVRQAIWHAIDRQSIADKLVHRRPRVSPGAPCYPTQFGCDGEAATLYDYDPAKAKALLAEAGYPERLRHSNSSATCCRNGRSRFRTICRRSASMRQAQPAAGQRRMSARAKARTPLGSRQLGQLLDQRRVGHHAELL